MNRLVIIASAVALTGCTTAQLATVETDITAIASKASALCAEVPTLVTLGDVANLLVPNLATTVALDVARSIQSKCVVVAAAQRSIAVGGSLASSAITVLTTQSVADLAGDVAVVKGAVK